MSARRPKAAVIIVTYNSERFIPDCLGSLAKVDTTGIDMEVLVIDNASKDRSVAMLKEHPIATVIANKDNLGFAGGNNQGIRIAMDRGADYAYLLNHDTEVTPAFLREAIRVAEAEERIGSVQSLLLLSPDKHLINSTGNAIHFLGFGYCLDYRRPVDGWRHRGLKEIAYPSGAGVLLRLEALREVGLFDEALFLYHEDLDLGWRLRLAGWQNVLAPHSVVYHKYEFSRSISKYYYMERNRYVVFLKNLRAWTLLLLAPFLLVAEAGLIVAAIKGGWWREKLKVYAYFLKPSAWAHIVSERLRVGKLRRASDREIVSLFTSTISYQEVAGPFTVYVANPLMTIVWFVLKIFII